MYDNAIALTRQPESVRGSQLKALYSVLPNWLPEPSERSIVDFKRAYLRVTGRELSPRTRNVVAIALRVHGREAEQHLGAIYAASHTTHNLLASLFLVPQASPDGKSD